MDFKKRSEEYLQKLCVDIGTRCVGSQGNRDAAEWFKNTIEGFGFRTESQEFDCLYWIDSGSTLIAGNDEFKLHTGPFSRPYKGSGRLQVIKNIDELRACHGAGRILLLTDDLVREQLMPKGFIFYNPDHHKEIVRLLEEKGALAIVAATSGNPALAGSLYPFPLIEDGDFTVPNCYMKDVDGKKLSSCEGTEIHLAINSECRDARGYNIIARKGDLSKGKVILCAHIDSKSGTPGAIDNATGIIILLMIAEMLAKYADIAVEIVALNGEDYYSIPGQMEYLKRVQEEQQNIRLVFNFDGAGFNGEKGAFSFYNCPEDLIMNLKKIAHDYPTLIEGEQWIQGDHAMFVQMGIGAIAFTSGDLSKISTDIIHTAKDNPSIVDHGITVDIARAVFDFLSAFLASDLP